MKKKYESPTINVVVLRAEDLMDYIPIGSSDQDPAAKPYTGRGSAGSQGFDQDLPRYSPWEEDE